jgi:hypothetical protein
VSHCYSGHILVLAPFAVDQAALLLHGAWKIQLPKIVAPGLFQRHRRSPSLLKCTRPRNLRFSARSSTSVTTDQQ